jgi:hypothetical protein
LRWRACEEAHQTSRPASEESRVDGQGGSFAALCSRGLSVACDEKVSARHRVFG